MRKWIGFLGLLATAALSWPAHADMILTQAGIDDGFALSTVISGFPSTNGLYGPFGVATNSNGNIVVQAYYAAPNSSPSPNNYVFTDVNNQTFAQGTPANPAFGAISYATGITNAGGVLYAGNNDTGQLVRLNNNGTFNSVVATTAPPGPVAGHGIWTNPVTGHIITSADNGIWDINPTNGVATHIVTTTANIDGVSVSLNGTVIYFASAGHVYGYNFAGQQVYDSGSIAGNPDGTGVIASGPFAGLIVVNFNDGTLHLLDPTAHTDTIIANNGSRGDYVGLDLNDSSLLITQSNTLLRLTCGDGCGFVSPAVPEPSTWAMMVIGFAGVGFLAYRRRNQFSAA